MNAEQAHDIVASILATAEDVRTITAAVAALLDLFNTYVGDGRVDTEPTSRQLAEYAVQLANTHAKSEALAMSLQRLAGARAALEDARASLHPMRMQSMVDGKLTGRPAGRRAQKVGR